MQRFKNLNNLPKPQNNYTKIPAELATFEEEGPDEAKGPFLISFANYDCNKCCEIDQLEKNAHKKALKDLIKIGRLNSTDKFRNNGIDFIPVRREGEYLKLFRKLTADIDLFEHKLQSTQRVFYYVIDRIINVVAITKSHFETTKVRR